MVNPDLTWEGVHLFTGGEGVRMTSLWDGYSLRFP